ncbi:hypothetical protein QE152_g8135 [Popillia japonica]|uniref:Uncharacterized protein n=1 Tax=Popillia japonica TaxID=7064 RepID=A0AAW1MD60_POPJA
MVAATVFTKCAGVSAAFILIAFHAQKRKRRWWQRQFLQNGTYYGDNLMAELLLNDGSSFRNFVRLTKSDFEEVLCLVGPKIFKKNTNYGAAIPPSIRLMVALRYLATEDSFTSPHLFQSGWPFWTFHHISYFYHDILDKNGHFGHFIIFHISITIFSTRNVP